MYSDINQLCNSVLYFFYVGIKKKGTKLFNKCLVIDMREVTLKKKERKMYHDLLPNTK